LQSITTILELIILQIASVSTHDSLNKLYIICYCKINVIAQCNDGLTFLVLRLCKICWACNAPV